MLRPKSALAKLADLLPGGAADNMSDKQFDPEELRKGVAEEKEHTKSKGIAKEIAKDHLVEECPKYYSHLKKLDRQMHKMSALTRLLKTAALNTATTADTAPQQAASPFLARAKQMFGKAQTMASNLDKKLGQVDANYSFPHPAYFMNTRQRMNHGLKPYLGSFNPETAQSISNFVHDNRNTIRGAARMVAGMGKSSSAKRADAQRAVAQETPNPNERAGVHMEQVPGFFGQLAQVPGVMADNFSKPLVGQDFGEKYLDVNQRYPRTIQGMTYLPFVGQGIGAFKGGMDGVAAYGQGNTAEAVANLAGAGASFFLPRVIQGSFGSMGTNAMAQAAPGVIANTLKNVAQQGVTSGIRNSVTRGGVNAVVREGAAQAAGTGLNKGVGLGAKALDRNNPTYDMPEVPQQVTKRSPSRFLHGPETVENPAFAKGPLGASRLPGMDRFNDVKTFSRVNPLRKSSSVMAKYAAVRDETFFRSSVLEKRAWNPVKAVGSAVNTVGNAARSVGNFAKQKVNDVNDWAVKKMDNAAEGYVRASDHVQQNYPRTYGAVKAVTPIVGNAMDAMDAGKDAGRVGKTEGDAMVNKAMRDATVGMAVDVANPAGRALGKPAAMLGKAVGNQIGKVTTNQVAKNLGNAAGRMAVTGAGNAAVQTGTTRALDGAVASLGNKTQSGVNPNRAPQIDNPAAPAAPPASPASRAFPDPSKIKPVPMPTDSPPPAPEMKIDGKNVPVAHAPMPTDSPPPTPAINLDGKNLNLNPPAKTSDGENDYGGASWGPESGKPSDDYGGASWGSLPVNTPPSQASDMMARPGDPKSQPNDMLYRTDKATADSMGRGEAPSSQKTPYGGNTQASDVSGKPTMTQPTAPRFSPMPPKGEETVPGMANPGRMPSKGDYPVEGMTNPGRIPSKGEEAVPGMTNPGRMPAKGDNQVEGMTNPGRMPSKGEETVPGISGSQTQSPSPAKPDQTPRIHQLPNGKWAYGVPPAPAAQPAPASSSSGGSVPDDTSSTAPTYSPQTSNTKNETAPFSKYQTPGGLAGGFVSAGRVPPLRMRDGIAVEGPSPTQRPRVINPYQPPRTPLTSERVTMGARPTPPGARQPAPAPASPPPPAPQAGNSVGTPPQATQSQAPPRPMTGREKAISYYVNNRQNMSPTMRKNLSPEVQEAMDKADRGEDWRQNPPKPSAPSYGTERIGPGSYARISPTYNEYRSRRR